MKLEAALATWGEPNSFTVSALYDFSATGPGTFTFDPASSFRVSGLNDTDETILDPVVINAEKARPIAITVTDHVSKRELGLEKRVTVGCTDSRKEWTIFLSFLDAKQLASEAASYLREHGSEGDAYLYDFWTSPMQQVLANFDAVANQDWATRTMSCSSTPRTCQSLGPAYTLDSSIHYCDSFYDSPSLGSHCKDVNRLPSGAITLRESTIVLQKAYLSSHICGLGPFGIPGASTAESYTVSTQTPRGLSDLVLTWDHDCCSASLSGSTRMPSVNDENRGRRGAPSGVCVWIVQNVTRDKW